jgi:hypothetical protein
MIPCILVSDALTYQTTQHETTEEHIPNLKVMKPSYHSSALFNDIKCCSLLSFCLASFTFNTARVGRVGIHNLEIYVTKSDYNVVRLPSCLFYWHSLFLEVLTRSVADRPSSNHCRSGARRKCVHPAVMDHRVTAFFYLSTRNLLHV